MEIKQKKAGPGLRHRPGAVYQHSFRPIFLKNQMAGSQLVKADSSRSAPTKAVSHKPASPED
ncbi:MAG: hypothetical protein RQ748_07665 [Elusimicrobiales bacterium]|nr:hypothetical protein [Elusimicrobiales bacterium]